MSSDEEVVTAIEDLMREHGVLNRLLLIYEEFIRRMENNIQFNHYLIVLTAYIIRKFVEDHHEKTEENYVFPVLLKKNICTQIIEQLKMEHTIGRKLTDMIFILSFNFPKEKEKLISTIKQFITMYRYHETREDTEVFFEFRKLYDNKQYELLSDIFEEDEKKVLGNNGFEKYFNAVKQIEKHLDIHNLQKITDNGKNFIQENIKLINKG